MLSRLPVKTISTAYGWFYSSDSDGDGVPDHLDNDDDGDGIPDDQEGEHITVITVIGYWWDEIFLFKGTNKQIDFSYAIIYSLIWTKDL